MKIQKRGHSCLILVLCAIMLCGAEVIRAQDTKPPQDNIIGEIEGNAKIIRKEVKLDAKPKDKVLIKDIIETQKDSRTKLLFTDNAILLLDQVTYLGLDAYARAEEGKKGTSGLSLSNGLTKVSKGLNDISITTPLSVASAKGGEGMNYVEYANMLGKKVTVNEGEMSCVVQDTPQGDPTTPKPVPSSMPWIDENIDFVVWETTTDDKPTFCVAVFKPKECDDICETLGLDGKCVVDVSQVGLPCDDSDRCTVDDVCQADGKCKGKKDPSPTDPKCK